VKTRESIGNFEVDSWDENKSRTYPEDHVISMKISKGNGVCLDLPASLMTEGIVFGLQLSRD
jgi:hypothetical protein